MTAASLLFVALLGLVTATRLWLLWRQRVAVLGARSQVPVEFVNDVPLDAHQKAADYTRAKVRVAALDILIDMGVALLITLGGGLMFIDNYLRLHGLNGVSLGLALIGTIAGAAALIGWPLSLYRTFVVEARFGFNRTNWKLYLADCGKGLVLA